MCVCKVGVKKPTLTKPTFFPNQHINTPRSFFRLRFSFFLDEEDNVFCDEAALPPPLSPAAPPSSFPPRLLLPRWPGGGRVESMRGGRWRVDCMKGGRLEWVEGESSDCDGWRFICKTKTRAPFSFSFFVLFPSSPPPSSLIELIING